MANIPALSDALQKTDQLILPPLATARNRIKSLFLDSEGLIDATKRNATEIVEILEQYPSLAKEWFFIAEEADPICYHPLTLLLWADVGAPLLERVFSFYKTPNKDLLHDELFRSFTMITWRNFPISDRTILAAIRHCMCVRKEGRYELRRLLKRLLRNRYICNSTISLGVFQAAAKENPTFLREAGASFLYSVIMIGYAMDIVKFLAGYQQPCQKLRLSGNTVGLGRDDPGRSLLSIKEAEALTTITVHKAKLIESLLGELVHLGCYPNIWTSDGFDHLLKAVTRSIALKRITLSLPTKWGTRDGEGCKTLKHFFQFKPPQLTDISLMPADYHRRRREGYHRRQRKVCDDGAWIQSLLQGLESNHCQLYPLLEKLEIRDFYDLDYYTPAQMGQFVQQLVIMRCGFTKTSSRERTSLSTTKPEIEALWSAVSANPAHKEWKVVCGYCVHEKLAVNTLTSVIINCEDEYCNGGPFSDVTNLLVSILQCPSISTLVFESVANVLSPTIGNSRTNDQQHRFDAIAVFNALKKNSSLERLELHAIFFGNANLSDIPSLMWNSIQGHPNLQKMIAFEGEHSFHILEERAPQKIYLDFRASAGIQLHCWLNEFGRVRMQDPTLSRKSFLDIILKAKRSRSRPNKKLSKLFQLLTTGSYPYGPHEGAFGRAENHHDTYLKLRERVDCWCHRPTGQYHADTLRILFGLLRESPGNWCSTNQMPVLLGKKRKFNCVA